MSETTPRLQLAGNPEVLPEEPADLALALRDTRVPVTLDDLAAKRDMAQEILDARLTILETARKRALRMTFPSDWNLYRNQQTGVVLCYLSDAGCQRVRDVLGVEVYDVSTPQKVTLADGSFMYLQQASGRSKLTTQIVEGVEGGRSSDEDFCRGAKGAELELLVRRATRANVNGNVARELLGLKNMPLTELQEAWQGTAKDWDHCNKARGYGSQDERLGATATGAPDVTPPTCTVCKTPEGAPLPLTFRKASGTRAAFYGCVNYTKHPNEKVIVDAAKWEQQRLDAEVASKS